MVERRSPKPDVEGSSPSGREFLKVEMNENTNNIVKDIKTYFKGVQTEWTKITWPEKNQIIVETLFVIAIVTAFTIAVFCVDKVYAWILGFIPTIR